MIHSTLFYQGSREPRKVEEWKWRPATGLTKIMGAKFIVSPRLFIGFITTTKIYQTLAQKIGFSRLTDRQGGPGVHSMQLIERSFGFSRLTDRQGGPGVHSMQLIERSFGFSRLTDRQGGPGVHSMQLIERSFCFSLNR